MIQTLQARNPVHAPTRQKGVATLLILLLVGLAVTVTALVVAYSLRSNQQRQLATHSVTTAQASAWRGVEFMRDVLQGMSSTDEGKQVLYGLSYDSPPTAGCIPAGATGSCAGGLVDKPAWDSKTGWLPGSTPLSGELPIDINPSHGFKAAITRVERMPGFHAYNVTARVTGKAAGSSNEPLATSTLEVVYEVGMQLSGSGGTCASLPTALMVFNGNLDITGGSLGVTEGTTTEYENIAVTGDITMNNAGAARVSGCAKRNIDVNGGGVTQNGHLHAEGDIRVHGSSPPQGTSLWGKNVTLDGSASGARYAQIKAGAFVVALVVDGESVGTANVAGSIIASTAVGTIPWTTGTVLLNKAIAPKFVVTLSGASPAEFLVDPKKLTVDSSSGVITGASAAAERLSGDGEFPDSFSLQTGSIFGGTFTALGLTGGGEYGADTQKTNQLWAHDITLGTGNQGFGIVELRSNGNLRVGRGRANTLVGGGGLWSGSRYGPNNYGNHIKVGSGSIAGQLYTADGASLPAGESMSGSGLNISTNAAGTTPGLPGIPYCDARVNAVDADAYKTQANYIFEFVGGVPMLTVSNVKTAAGQSIDGTYNLRTDDLRRMPAGSGAPFLLCNWQKDAGNDGAHCFRNATPATGWKITGLVSLPKGVVWFDGAFTVDGTDGGLDLINTIVGTGKVTLTQGGHGKLYAPNFSTPAILCDGSFWPTNLCDKRSGASKFASWTERVVDVAGNESEVIRTGLPIGNMAVVTEGAGELLGWNIYGNIMLGEAMVSGANLTQVQGTLTVGANRPSNTLITQGGAQISVPSDSDKLYLPVCESIPGVYVPTASVRWSRYL